MMDGTVSDGGMGGADLLIYGLLFAGVLLTCALGVLAIRVMWTRWTTPPPPEPVPTPEERIRVAVHCLENAGVDLAGVLGDWSPTNR
jgi:hypothetical protein